MEILNKLSQTVFSLFHDRVKVHIAGHPLGDPIIGCLVQFQDSKVILTLPLHLLRFLELSLDAWKLIASPGYRRSENLFVRAVVRNGIRSGLNCKPRKGLIRPNG
ncbi:MAG: hypothetical protein U1A27_10650 [Phycisphaerae bacterium]